MTRVGPVGVLVPAARSARVDEALDAQALRCSARAPRSPLVPALVDLGHACLDRLGAPR